MEQEIQANEMDVLVIGGGITGAGIALDAVKRGMNVALVEMQDFAAGTSSRSTKLVHGGLRYLKQFEVGLVAEVGKEREIVYENAPHVTTPEWMMLPFYKGGTFGPLSTNIGLRVYDFLAGVKKAERRKMLRPNEALAREPLLQAETLKGAGYYVEYKTDDARLTLEVIKKAVELGANALNYTKVTSLTYEAGQVSGANIEDQITGQTYTISAKKVVNATGPWVDNIREMDKSKEGKTLQLTKGVHLVFDEAIFPLRQAIYFDTHDKRMIFAIPRAGKTYVGTTDTLFADDIVHPVVTKKDVDYLLDAINWMFPTLNVTRNHIESSWAGVRPLIAAGEGKNPSEISRKDEVLHSQSGLYSMAGGKLTGYRKMAETIVDQLANDLKKEVGIVYQPSGTKHLRLSGGHEDGASGFAKYRQQQIEFGQTYGLTEKQATSFVDLYGTNCEKVYVYLLADEANAAQLPIDIFAMLQYGLVHEFVQRPVDFFIRRIGALYFDVATATKYAEQVTHYMGDYFDWSDTQTTAYLAELLAFVDEAKLTDLKK